MLKIGDLAKVVIKQDMKGRRHKYGFNNNKREKAQKKRVVDDETGDKHHWGTSAWRRERPGRATIRKARTPPRSVHAAAISNAKR